MPLESDLRSSRGYAVTFLKQMEHVLCEAIARGVKIVANAGGLNPAALAAELFALRDGLGLKAKVLQIEGDDLLSQLEPLQKAGRELKHLDMSQPLRDLRARDLRGYAWLEKYLTAERLKQFVTETAGLEVRRYELPNLKALSFVVVGLLCEGVASSVRFDPQAKSLGEYLRSRMVELPVTFLNSA
jgi:Acyclic terpene utilisation family protein AtuA